MIDKVMIFETSVLKKIFKELLLKGELDEDEEEGCLARMEISEFKDGNLFIKTPSRYYKDYYTERYQIKFSNQISEMEGVPIQIIFEVKPNSEPSNTDKNITYTATLPSSEKIIKKRPEGLNDRYSFSNFIVGESNLPAQKAALCIAENPGTSYNPCLMYGGVGLGKTHLLQAIGNDIFKNFPELKIVYVTAEKLFTDFTSHIRNSQSDYKNKNQNNDFKSKYRQVDVLLIDDIHTLQGKKATQEEVFHTFNDLYEGKKQIVFTCDRPISELKDISERLKSRFGLGLVMDLQPPNFETKIAIIQKKLESYGTKFSDEVVELISKTILTNVRDLEAAITNIHGYADLTERTVTLKLAKERLKISIATTQMTNIISIERVQRIIAGYFNVSISDLKGKKKNKSIVYPRQIAMYICRKMTDYPTTEIGLEFGGRDHTTVMHSCNKISDLKISDPNLDATIQNLMRSVREHEDKM